MKNASPSIMWGGVFIMLKISELDVFFNKNTT